MPRLAACALLASLAAAAASAGPGDDWKEVDFMIQNFSFAHHMSFTAGDATGRKHTFAKGLLRMWTPVALASSSKFPVALAIAGAVHEGHLSFDTRANQVFPWWTNDSTDKRSGVTLRHLLSFTSGLVSADVGGGGLPCLESLNASFYSPEGCAQEIYQRGPFIAEPGTTWSYHSMHLQIAGAMAAKAAGLTVRQLLNKYLIQKLDLQTTFWLGYPNPHLAAAMISTGNDYDKILRSVLSYEILPKSILDQMERDYIVPPVQPSNQSKDQFLLSGFGHYSMCLYFECMGQNWSETCVRQGVHSDPGALGYWPLINREKGYYMQLVNMRFVRVPKWVADKYHIDASTAASLPAMCTAPLRFGLQPFVEQALGRNDTSSSESSVAFRGPHRLRDDPLPPEVCQLVQVQDDEALVAGAKAAARAYMQGLDPVASQELLV